MWTTVAGRKSRLVLSALADRDFDRIYLFTSERWGIDQADEYTSQLWESLQTIARHPDIGKLQNSIGREIRCFVPREYAIWYRIEDDAVRILRITHERMNPELIDFGD